MMACTCPKPTVRLPGNAPGASRRRLAAGPSYCRAVTLLALACSAAAAAQTDERRAAAPQEPPAATTQPTEPAEPPLLTADQLQAVVGIWQMNSRLGDSTIEATMVITAEGGRLAGVWKSMDREMPLADLRLSGNELTFTRSLEHDRALRFHGTISGNRLSGVYRAPHGDIASSGARIPDPAGPKATPATHPPPLPGVLDGKEKSIVVLGSASSYAWPTLLQDLLDDHAGSQRTYHVLNAAVGGTPVERWNSASTTKSYQATFGTLVRDYFGDRPRMRGPAPPPTVALCQVSLQLTGTPAGPVQAADDREGIAKGADALDQLALRLHSLGIERCFIATDIYTPRSEPQVGNERFALKAVLDRGRAYIQPGPDVWSRTVTDSPDRLRQEDQLNPNEPCAKILAEAWYRTLAGPQANEQVIQLMHQRTCDISRLTLDYLRSRNPRIAPPPQR